MMAGFAGPPWFVEGDDATAEFNLTCRTSFLLIRIREAIDNRDAGEGTALRAGRVYFNLSHDSVLSPFNDRNGHVLGQKDSRRL